MIDLSGARHKDPDHARAVKATQMACAVKKINPSGLKHLRRLLSKKTDVSYGEERVTFDAATALAYSSQQFQGWALSILKRGRRLS